MSISDNRYTIFPLDEVGLKWQIPLEISWTTVELIPVIPDVFAKYFNMQEVYKNSCEYFFVGTEQGMEIPQLDSEILRETLKISWQIPRKLYWGSNSKS